MTRLSLAAMALGLGLAVTAAEAQQAQRPPARPQPRQAPQQQPRQAPQPQPAQPVPSGPRSLGTFESWTAIELVDRSGKVCYMVAYPAQKEPKNRGDIMMTVSHRPSAKQQNQVSFHAGYPYKDGVPVTIEIERRKFELFTRPEVDEDAAWTQDAAADKTLVNAMRAGKSMTVSGTSARGTKTVDTISLAGFGRALTEINKACGVRG